MYVKVWTVYPQKGKTIGARCSAMSKNRDGEYIPSFSGIINFCGSQAVDTILSVAPASANGNTVKFESDSAPSMNVEEITLQGGLVEHGDDGKPTGNYTPYRFTAFKATLRGDGSGAKKAPKQSSVSKPVESGFVAVPDGIEEELPFA